MALTLRSNGSLSTNIITSQWFNDFYNLLTGAMSDQPVYINNGITLKQITYTTPTAPTLALHAGTSMGIGSYTYAISFGMSNGLSVPGTTATITTTTGNQQVNLTAIATGPTGTNYRNIYRSKVGTTSPLYYVASLGNNTTTTFLDTVADGSLGVLAPTHDYFGGYLQIVNSAGTIIATLFNDGYTSGIRGITTLFPPQTQVRILNGVSISVGSSTTVTCSGGTTGVPVGATAAIVSMFWSSPTVTTYILGVPHGTTITDITFYPSFGEVQVSGGFSVGYYPVLLGTGGQVDFYAENGSASNVTASIVGYIW